MNLAIEIEISYWSTIFIHNYVTQSGECWINETILHVYKFPTYKGEGNRDMSPRMRDVVV